MSGARKEAIGFSAQYNQVIRVGLKAVLTVRNVDYANIAFKKALRDWGEVSLHLSCCLRTMNNSGGCRAVVNIASGISTSLV